MHGKIHHDNTRQCTQPHLCSILSQTSHSTGVSPTYSPEIAPCDIFVFPSIKNKLNIMQQLTDILKTECEKSYQQWKSWWNTCIQAEGAYFKED
jgi:hypothetical protein